MIPESFSRQCYGCSIGYQLYLITLFNSSLRLSCNRSLIIAIASIQKALLSYAGNPTEKVSWKTIG